MVAPPELPVVTNTRVAPGNLVVDVAHPPFVGGAPQRVVGGHRHALHPLPDVGDGGVGQQPAAQRLDFAGQVPHKLAGAAPATVGTGAGLSEHVGCETVWVRETRA